MRSPRPSFTVSLITKWHSRSENTYIRSYRVVSSLGTSLSLFVDSSAVSFLSADWDRGFSVCSACGVLASNPGAIMEEGLVERLDVPSPSWKDMVRSHWLNRLLRRRSCSVDASAVVELPDASCSRDGCRLRRLSSRQRRRMPIRSSRLALVIASMPADRVPVRAWAGSRPICAAKSIIGLTDVADGGRPSSAPLS